MVVLRIVLFISDTVVDPKRLGASAREKYLAAVAAKEPDEHASRSPTSCTTLDGAVAEELDRVGKTI